MLKRLFDSDTYRKLGCPDLNSVMYFTQKGKKVYGKIISVSFHGHKGKIQLGLEPFKKQ